MRPRGVLLSFAGFVLRLSPPSIAMAQFGGYHKRGSTVESRAQTKRVANAKRIRPHAAAHLRPPPPPRRRTIAPLVPFGQQYLSPISKRPQESDAARAKQTLAIWREKGESSSLATELALTGWSLQSQVER